MNEINHRMTELEQKRSDPLSLAPSYAEIAGTPSSAPKCGFYSLISFIILEHKEVGI